MPEDLKVFYNKTFKGKAVPDDDFDRLADIAGDVLLEVCCVKPTTECKATPEYKRALCYEIEMLYSQGGVEAIVGFSEQSQKVTSQRVGEVSMTYGNASSGKFETVNGIPISPLTKGILTRLGLMSRWRTRKED